jgi:hypothetical protein
LLIVKPELTMVSCMQEASPTRADYDGRRIAGSKHTRLRVP